ncbi:MAG: ERAP1-like C-terminal domain-containing protein [Deltaproteobacteria bacterium]|nr:ERAP1-like C-terminal domain-containing protein [Deltaproteobacteria bacterium]
MNRPLALALVAACSGGAKAPSPQPPVDKPVAGAPKEAPPDATPPQLRLPDTVAPQRVRAELAIDPASEDFTGTIAFDLEVKRETRVLWLNADEEIAVDKVVLEGGGGPIAVTQVTPKPKEYLGLVLARPLAAGTAKLTITYRGKQHRNDGTGIYTAQEAGDWYAFTQFEATDAREAFPCFDEPSFKVPWTISIRTKKELAAFSNTPIASEKDEGNGQKLVTFAETRPLPSYLVAFAVGPFDAVDAGKTRAGKPIRIVVPRGRGGDVAYPVEATRPIVDLLEDYFGMPYPYEKLDLVAVSVFNAGAMENPGLVTYRQGILVTKPAEMTLGKKKSFAIVTAHELAHQWFGDYVTLAWWDDTWLNESFASWMETKIVEKFKPEWEIDVERVEGKASAMGSDSLDSARAIRQPIKSNDDIHNAFDGITYAKGEAVLTMIERTIGPDVFQKGVRAYLAKHAWGNATYEDFVAAMTGAAGSDLRKMFDSFVLQSGVPLVSVELKCEAGKARLVLDQRRYVPTGSKIDPDRTWHLPVCVRWGSGKDTGKQCTTMTGAHAELELAAKACPDWVLPNDSGLGYYRMLPKGPLLDKLLAVAPKALSLPERVGLLGDVDALVRSGDVSNGVALGLVETLAKDKSRQIVDASIGVVAGIDEMVPDDLRPNYQRLIKKLYRQRAIDLGWTVKKGEDDNVKQLRPTLLALVADTGRDPELIKQATALTAKWFDDHAAIDPELVGVALSVAARFGDQKLFDRFHAAAKAAKDRAERGRLLGAMAAFADPKIVAQAMAITLTDEFELREALGLLQGGFAERATRESAYRFMRDNFDAISNKLPEAYRPYMAFTFVALCDDGRKKEFEDFFRPRIAKLDGGPRIMDQALEALTLCAAARKAQTPGVIAFLRRQ